MPARPDQARQLAPPRPARRSFPAAAVNGKPKPAGKNGQAQTPGPMVRLDRVTRADLRAHAIERPDLAESALHEAGHAAAARAVERPVAAVGLDVDPVYRGTTWTLPAADDPAIVEQTILIQAAGPIAARRVFPNAGGADSDDSAMRKTARRLVGLRAPLAESWAVIAQANERAEALVEALWPQIQAVAAALLNFHKSLAAVPPYAEPPQNPDRRPDSTP